MGGDESLREEVASVVGDPTANVGRSGGFDSESDGKKL
jgi:hypothetical protein